MTKSKELYSEIIGIFYDTKELVRYYRGNIIALLIGIAIPIFNQNRNNQGMFFNYFERTVQIPDESTLNQQTSIDNIPSTLDYTESTTESNYFDETTSQDVTTFPDITSSDDMLLISNTQDETVTEKIVKRQGNLYLFFSDLIRLIRQRLIH